MRPGDHFGRSDGGGVGSTPPVQGGNPGVPHNADVGRGVGTNGVDVALAGEKQ